MPSELLDAPPVNGFINDAAAQTPSAVLVEQYQVAARDLAQAVAERRDAILPCDPTRDGEVACGSRFVSELGRRAFRRPLTTDETTTFTDFFGAQLAANNFNVALQLVIQAMLQSPAFLYRLEEGPVVARNGAAAGLTGYELASRLSYFLWGTMPDQELFAAAEAGALGTVSEIEEQARRMLLDPRANQRIADFVGQWLNFDGIATLEKVPTIFPAWSEELRGGMAAEATHLAQRVAHEPGNFVETLLTSRKTYVSGPLAQLYGVSAPGPDGGWVDLDRAERAGILTQPWLLATLAHPNDTSPIFRGVFVMARLLCSPPPPPPPNVNATLPAGNGDVIRTNRQRVERHAADATCAACHLPIDGLGFGLESFDAIGRFRTTDNGEPIDASGTLVGTDVDGPYRGGVELSERLSGSTMVKDCVARQVFRFAFGRTETADEECRMGTFADAFKAAGYDVREYIINVVKSRDFRWRRTAAGTNP